MNERRLGFWAITGRVIIGLFTAAVMSLIIGIIAMVLWNWLMPAVFGLGVITYWEAFGIVLLAKLVFGSFGMHRHGNGGGACGDENWKDNARHWHGAGRYGKQTGRHWHRHWKTDRFDDMYEDWWKAEGAQSFEDYMSKNNEPEEKNE